jgi:O-antigen/teichoic acid export membrane protein
MRVQSGETGPKLGHHALLGATDQVLLATVHFLLGVIVARQGGVMALGAFAFAYAVIVLANMAHAAVVAESYVVAPSVSEAAGLGGATPVVIMTLSLCLACAGIAWAMGWLTDEARVWLRQPSFLWALLCSSLFWATKPYYYRMGRPLAVLGATLVYGAVLLAVAFLGYRTMGPSMQPMWAIAAGAASACVPLLWCCKRPNAAVMKAFGAYARTGLHYATWSLPAALLIWVNSNGYVFFLSLLASQEQAGGLRAVLNLVAPVNTLLVGACTALLPLLAELVRREGIAAYAKRIHWLVALMSVGLLVLGLMIAPFSAAALDMLYGERYAAFAQALQLAAFLPPLWVAGSIYRTAIASGGMQSEGKHEGLYFCTCELREAVAVATVCGDGVDCRAVSA